MKIKSVAVIGAVCLLVTGICYLLDFLPNSSKTSESSQVVVSTNLPLSGNLAVYGVSIKRGVELALKDSIPSKLQFIWSDNKSDVKESVTIMQRDLRREPHIYLSGASPHQVKAIWSEISSRNIPHFVWIFEKQINTNTEKNNFRTWVNFKQEPETYLQYVEFSKPQRIAILYTQNPAYKDEFDNTLIPALKSIGINQIMSEEYPYEGADYRSLAEKAKLFNPDLTIFAGYQSHLVGLVRAFRPLGLIKDGNTIATYDMLDTSTVLGEDELEGIRVVAPVFVTRPNSPERVAWVAKFEREYRVSPLYTDAYAYDMTRIIQNTASRLPSRASHEDWIRTLREVDMEGITGPLKFDDDGSLLTSIEVGVFREGNVVPDDAMTASGIVK